MTDETEYPRVYIGDEPDTTAPVVTVGGVVMVSRQLLEQSSLTATDLDGKTATFDERIADELAAAYDPDYVSKYRWPEPVPPKELTRIERLGDRFGRWVARKLIRLAYRFHQDDEDDWEDE